MSQEDFEIVRRSFDAWNELDIEAIRRCYTEEAVIETGIIELGIFAAKRQRHRSGLPETRMGARHVCQPRRASTTAPRRPP
jgi:ketosteroid isomerase-like protein